MAKTHYAMSIGAIIFGIMVGLGNQYRSVVQTTVYSLTVNYKRIFGV